VYLMCVQWKCNKKYKKKICHLEKRTYQDSVRIFPSWGVHMRKKNKIKTGIASSEITTMIVQSRNIHAEASVNSVASLMLSRSQPSVQIKVI